MLQVLARHKDRLVQKRLKDLAGQTDTQDQKRLLLYRCILNFRDDLTLLFFAIMHRLPKQL